VGGSQTTAVTDRPAASVSIRTALRPVSKVTFGSCSKRLDSHRPRIALGPQQHG